MRQPITKAWIDESGDPGFKFKLGSSRFLIVGLVYLIVKKDRIVETEKKIREESEF